MSSDEVAPEPPATAAEFEMVVETGKVREFAAAVRARGEGYGAPDATVPPTFLATARLWRGDGDPGTAEGRALHGEQIYEFFGPPPRVGNRLVCRERVAREYRKQRRDGGTLRFVDVVTEFVDGERVVARSTMTKIYPAGES